MELVSRNTRSLVTKITYSLCHRRKINFTFRASSRHSFGTISRFLFDHFVAYVTVHTCCVREIRYFLCARLKRT